jgi:hypothetical protein
MSSSRTSPGLHATAREYAGLYLSSPGLSDSPWATRYRPRVRGLTLRRPLPACYRAIVRLYLLTQNELSEVLNRNTTREPLLSLLRQADRQFLCAHRNTIRQLIK